jgi:8-oxo-dGTP diphosphatase
LVIKKNRGPYRGKFDLPGGRVEFGETIEECLKREICEETGLIISKSSFLTIEENIFEYFDEKKQIKKKFHHIGVYYSVSVKNDKIKKDNDGHDSDGSLWVDIDSINMKNISPISLKAIRKK